MWWSLCIQGFQACAALVDIHEAGLRFSALHLLAADVDLRMPLAGLLKQGDAPVMGGSGVPLFLALLLSMATSSVWDISAGR